MSSPMPDLSPIGNEATAMSYAELVARLRAQFTEHLTTVGDHEYEHDPLCDEAATAIETLEAEVTKLRDQIVDMKETMQDAVDRYKDTP